MAKDARIDAYVANSPEFARPILEHFREVVHAACPRVVETIKWGHPSFEHGGPLCGMAAFKQHCRIGFPKGALLDEGGLEKLDANMGAYMHVTTVKDLPSRAVLSRMVQQAASLNEQGVRAPRADRSPKPEIAMPDDLTAALKKNRKALTAFEAFPPSHRREYVEWITGAKREETRQKRLATAISQIAEGKPQNWKYMK